MTEVDLTKRVLPGVEGCAWRLKAHWNPESVHDWLVVETMAQTNAVICAKAIADIAAAGVLGFALNTTDVRDAVTGPEGVLELFGQAVRARLNMQRTPGGLYVPRKF